MHNNLYDDINSVRKLSPSRLFVRLALAPRILFELNGVFSQHAVPVFVCSSYSVQFILIHVNLKLSGGHWPGPWSCCVDISVLFKVSSKSDSIWEADRRSFIPEIRSRSLNPHANLNSQQYIVTQCLSWVKNKANQINTHLKQTLFPQIRNVTRT